MKRSLHKLFLRLKVTLEIPFQGLNPRNKSTRTTVKNKLVRKLSLLQKNFETRFLRKDSVVEVSKGKTVKTRKKLKKFTVSEDCFEQEILVNVKLRISSYFWSKIEEQTVFFGMTFDLKGALLAFKN